MRTQTDFFSMLSSPARSSAAGGGRSTGADAAVAREMLDLVEFSISALRQQVCDNSFNVAATEISKSEGCI